MTTAQVDAAAQTAESEDAKWRTHVLRLRQLVRIAFRQKEITAERAKAAKAEYEAVVDELLEAIDACEREPGPLYAKNFQADTDPEAEALATPLATVFEAGELSESITAKFAAINLKTVGELAKWIEGVRTVPGEPATFNRLTDVPGIGEAKGEKVQQALDSFWERWRAEHPVADANESTPAE